MTTTVFSPSLAQRAAIDDVIAWYRNPDDPRQVYRLFGWAGSGKTSLAQRIVAELGLTDVRYAAYTGKAAYVLRTKGCPEACTVHSLIYTPLGQDRREIDRLQTELRMLNDREQLTEDPNELAMIPVRRDFLTEKLAAEEAKPQKLTFVLKEESDFEGAELLVLDEASMVDQRMALDLMSYGVRILVLGDPAQLPPVGGEGYFTDAPADHLLTEVHRSALDSAPTRIATIARQSCDGDQTFGIRGPVGDSGRVMRPPALSEFDQILVGTNKVRWAVNEMIRRSLGRPTMPVPTDRIIVLKNSREAGVFNGQLFSVLTCVDHPETVDRTTGRKYRLQVVEEGTGTERELDVWADGFRDQRGERDVSRGHGGRTAAATFAFAITVHKSQGSQWRSVLVLDESSLMMYLARKDGKGVAAQFAQARSWFYTAVTRASHRVVICAAQTVVR